MIRFFDASALVKRYVDEPESEQVAALLDEGTPAVCRITEVEISSALARRRHEGDLTDVDYERAVTALRTDLQWLHVVELDRQMIGSTHDLLRRHRLRAGDAVQLAACLELSRGYGLDVQFVAYDVRLTDAGRREGLVVLPG